MSGCCDETSDKAKMERILDEESIGHLALAEGDKAYVVPLNYTYLDGKILFHCALEGRKLDTIRKNPQVCFAVSRQQGPPAPHIGIKCDTGFESVLCYGVARIVEEIAERQAILNAFQERYSTPEKVWPPVTPERAAKCGAVEITITRMTGRLYSSEGKWDWEWQA